MNKNNQIKFTIKLIMRILFLFVAILLICGTFFVANEGEYVVVKEFGKIVKVIDSPGLNLKNPITQGKESLSKKVMLYDLPPSDIITTDKKTMTVDSYVPYKIVEPMTFLKTVVNTKEAERRLDASVYNAIKTTMGQYEQSDIIQKRNGAIGEKITGMVKESMLRYGIEVIDVQVKTFDLPNENKQAVYNRMISERNQIAAQYNAEGKELANKIKNAANAEARTLVAESKATAEKIIAEGEAKYMQIMAEAYSGAERVEFYEFTRSLEALKISMKGSKTLVLPIDSPLTKVFLGY